jgi:hypothetical protein
VPRGFGFVHHSRAIFCRAAPNLSITIRNFFIAVYLHARHAEERRGTHGGGRRQVTRGEAIVTHVSACPTTSTSEPMYAWFPQIASGGFSVTLDKRGRSTQPLTVREPEPTACVTAPWVAPSEHSPTKHSLYGPHLRSVSVSNMSSSASRGVVVEPPSPSPRGTLSLARPRPALDTQNPRGLPPVREG